MTGFKQKVLAVLMKLQDLCERIGSYEHDTKKGIEYAAEDVVPPLQSKQDLLDVIQYLDKNELKISMYKVFRDDDDGDAIRDFVGPGKYLDEKSVPLGVIKGKNIETIQKIIEKNINKINPEIKAQSAQAIAKGLDSKKIKQKFISKLKMTDDSLYFGEEKIPVESGQNTITKLFLTNAETSIGGKLNKKGKSIALTELQQAGGYKDEASSRDGLKKLKAKLRKTKWPVSIRNVSAGRYQMKIKYNKKNKTHK